MRSESATITRSSRFCVPVLCFSSGIPVASAEPGRGRNFCFDTERKDAMKIKQKKVGIAIGISITGLLSTFAMPTAKEIEEIVPMVEELMKADVEKMKQGVAKPSDVAEAAFKLAQAADTPAAQYYLLTSAVPYFAKDGRYDRIIATVDMIKEVIPDIPLRDLVKLVDPIALRAPKADSSANRLRMMVSDYRTKVQYEASAEKLRREIAKNPTDKSLHTKLAELLVVAGNWQVALLEFTQGDDKAVASIAKAELEVGGIAKVREVADFWWGMSKGRSKSVCQAFRQHAIELYKSGIADGKITGLAKVKCERRIAEFGDRMSAQSATRVIPNVAQGDSAHGGSTREFRIGDGINVRFVSCGGGMFTMGWPEEELKKNPDAAKLYRRHEVKLSKNFWMMETLVSERMWAAVMGEVSDSDKPRAATYEEVEKFVAKLNEAQGRGLPTGYAFRLPTYAEYEYALVSGGAEQGTPFAQLQPKGDSIRQAVDEDVTKPKPNKWNLRGLRLKGGYVWLADQIGFDKGEMSPTSYRWDATGMRLNRINWPDTSTDPLIPLSGGYSQHHVFLRDADTLQPYGATDNKARALFRLVIGSALKAEKK